MMIRIYAIAVLVVITTLAGCRTTPARSWYYRGFSYTEAREHLASFRNVFLVCITADHVEDLDPTLPVSWSVLCFEGTVVSKYKGDWKVGERIKFAHALDCTVKKQNNTHVGELMFLFTDLYTNTEFAVDTGDFEKYQPDTDRLLRSLLRTDPNE